MIFIGLGTNLGDTRKNLEKAYSLLEAAGCKVLRRSSFYRSEPWGKTDQPEFLNAVAEVGFEKSPQELLDLLLQTEQQLGRIRLEKWGPRLIDLDLILYHDQIIDEARLQIPHPFFLERSFVLLPLAELAPDLIPIGQTLSISQLLNELDLSGIHKIPSLPS